MRLVSAVAGVFLIVIGGIAAVTGSAAMHGVWAVIVALAVLGLTGLVTAVSETR